MKHKMIENVPTKKREYGGSATTVTTQIIEDTMVLNIWKGQELFYRYCIRETGEYEVFDGLWSRERFYNLIGCRWYYDSKKVESVKFDTNEDEKLAEKWLEGRDVQYRTRYALWDKIDSMERDYRWDYEERKEDRRRERVYDRMMQIPKAPEDLLVWTREKIGDPDFAFWDKERETWDLTCCGRSRKRIKAKHLEEITCPVCKKKITAMRRRGKVERAERVLVMDTSPIGGLMRYFLIEFLWIGKEKRAIVTENVRILLDDTYRNKPVYWRRGNAFDNKSNYNQLRDYNYVTWLYDRGAEAAVRGTRFEPVGKLLTPMNGRKARFNDWMFLADRPDALTVLEYLIKGRYFRLAEEWYESRGFMNFRKQDIEGVLRIKDRQKINRIRDKNGGALMLSWMQWADRCHKKIADSFLSWAEGAKVYSDQGPWLFLKMSPEAAMNYIEKQRKAYKLSVRGTISQYEDYMGMCQKLDKDLADEMVVKPRELKRRHDEAVKELEFRQAELDAEKYSKRFPEAERVLSEIRKNLEYKGQQYEIKVPERIVDIVVEGRYLHHCAGATDRYFDRIASHETYIVFLRKNKEPETPYYTVEVEPGGTIRQHRGMFDEEPDIEKVKPFLREWQREIKKRMKAKDRERAKISAIKREENIKDLKAKNNTRVLQGLMEDFMEAI